MQKLKDPILLSVYNQNLEPKLIDLFSENPIPHTGVVGDISLLKNNKIKGVNLQLNYFKRFMFSTFQLKKQNYCYAYFLDKLQFQTDVLFLGFEWSNQDGFLLELPSKSDLYMVCFPTGCNSNEGEANLNFANEFKLPEYQLGVYVKNKTMFPINNINILDIINGCEINDENIECRVIAKKLPDGKNLEFTKIRVFTDNKQQFYQPFKFDSTNCLPYSYFSYTQFQDIVVDIPFLERKILNSNFLIRVLPTTEVMYYFI